LCDITSGNPNVFFELGVRTAVDKPVSIVKDTKTPGIPFDTAIINVHTYDPSLAPWSLSDDIDKLSGHLRSVIAKSEGRNALWRYFGLTTRAAFRPGESTIEEKIDLIMLQLQERDRLRRVDITRNPEANFLLFSEAARGVLGDENYSNTVITAVNDTVTIDLMAPISRDQRYRVQVLADKFGYAVVYRKIYEGAWENET
jgi:hypothetical protein